MMEQLLLFAMSMPQEPASNPLESLAHSADPGWLEDILDQWDTIDGLVNYLEDLKHDLRHLEEVPDRQRSNWDRSVMHDLKDTIRVISARIRILRGKSDDVHH